MSGTKYIKKRLEERNLITEAVFTASRSSGPGGQNVNKVNTRVELRFNVEASLLLTEYEKCVILKTLKLQITKENELIIDSQTERSQLKNKEKTVDKLYTILGLALTPRKKRIPSKPTNTSKLRRLETKKLRSIDKKLRRKVE